MAGTKQKLENRILLLDSKFYSESNGIKKKGGFIQHFLSQGPDKFSKVLKCVHIWFKQKSYTEVQISGSFYTYM